MYTACLLSNFRHACISHNMHSQQYTIQREWDDENLNHAPLFPPLENGLYSQEKQPASRDDESRYAPKYKVLICLLIFSICYV